ncbi:DUF305 domain-containing protein [Mycolicibacterium hippocampi]|uniref:DUF305 domain-containing protein n=1 Tax=Mycolicibacterium hippocampi TaxID=659824 RepID=A0A7I9ZUD2_9MYCO|nr:DUF305 domain-containing protein [Mycolicibacterium hippocampi]GFH04554.1 DUF305 domain-containing protein [Mycolicibacterium hippocampi]
MRKHSVQVGVGAVGATLVLLMAGCSSDGTEAGQDTATPPQESTSQAAEGHDGAHGDTHNDAHNDPPTDPPNDADVAFARDMIPHHEQAIVMSDIILVKQDIDPRVTELANQIKAAQGPEIETMRGWLAQWGAAPAPSGHEGHDMPGDPPMHGSVHEAMGMMTDQQLEALRQAQGADASRQFLTGMIQHHEGAVTMAQSEIDAGQFDPAVALATDIIEAQVREIDTMRQILDSM